LLSEIDAVRAGLHKASQVREHDLGAGSMLHVGARYRRLSLTKKTYGRCKVDNRDGSVDGDGNTTSGFKINHVVSDGSMDDALVGLLVIGRQLDNVGSKTNENNLVNAWHTRKRDGARARTLEEIYFLCSHENSWTKKLAAIHFQGAYHDSNVKTSIFGWESLKYASMV
jgi:hypothetical protein